MIPVKLSEISKKLGFLTRPDFDSLEISGVSSDSRNIHPGFIFVAIKGSLTDGHRYIPEAIERGCIAVVGTENIETCPVPYIKVQDGREALACIAACLYQFPAHKLTMIGVTGTDGKTTTCNMIYQILQAAGLKVGMITTVNALVGEKELDTGYHVTTPEAIEIQSFLSKMVSAGIEYAIIETTSHGIEQKRVSQCEFDYAVLTNITHEHLDYHGTFESYLETKSKLFSTLSNTNLKSHGPGRGAILNLDDPSFGYIASKTSVPFFSYGIENPADFTAKQLTSVLDGLSFQVRSKKFSGGISEFTVNLPLFGLFNVYNCLGAIALTWGLLGIDVEHIANGLANLRGVPGRMEKIDLGQGFTAIVDFAHTPNALENTLKTLRNSILDSTTSGRIIAVFGSAGLRDREKRRKMAEISTVLSDLSIFTAEDPRTESLESILNEMADGAKSKGGIENKNFWRIPDRGEAILFAVQMAKPGDVVIACGKGHEQSMCFGDKEYPWDDRIAVRSALADLLRVAGPEMPYLPTRG